jgi:hypothetical protein
MVWRLSPLNLKVGTYNFMSEKFNGNMPSSVSDVILGRIRCYIGPSNHKHWDMPPVVCLFYGIPYYAVKSSCSACFSSLFNCNRYSSCTFFRGLKIWKSHKQGPMMIKEDGAHYLAEIFGPWIFFSEGKLQNVSVGCWILWLRFIVVTSSSVTAYLAGRLLNLDLQSFTLGWAPFELTNYTVAGIFD